MGRSRYTPGSTSELASAIRDNIFRIESVTGKTFAEYMEGSINTEVAKAKKRDRLAIQLDPTEFNWSAGAALSPRAVDFGYLVEDKDGELVDVFGPDAPVDPKAAEEGSLMIEGYEPPPNAVVMRVGAQGYNKAMKEMVENLQAEAQSDSVVMGLQEVSSREKKATTTVAVQMCPNGYYPTEIKLHMSIDFDFVLIKSDFGTELTLRMSEVCQGFFEFLEAEIDKLTP